MLFNWLANDCHLSWFKSWRDHLKVIYLILLQFINRSMREAQANEYSRERYSISKRMTVAQGVFTTNVVVRCFRSGLGYSLFAHPLLYRLVFHSQTKTIKDCPGFYLIKLLKNTQGGFQKKRSIRSMPGLK